MNGPTISRRGFLAGTGSVAVGFSMAATLAEMAHAAPNKGGRMLSDSWIVVTGSTPGGTGTLVTIYAGKVELGTGIQTALSQIVAEELNVTMSQLAYVQGDTDLTPGSQGYTAGSKSVQNDGPPMRRAAATAMQGLLALAAAQFGVAASQLRANGGRIGTGQTSTGGKTYGDLINGQTLTLASAAGVAVKSPADYILVGRSVPRVDLPDKFKATYKYVSDLKLPGMLHARVIRPSGRNAKFNDWGPDGALSSIPGFVSKHQVGNFVFVVGQTEYAAISAQTLLSRGPAAVKWTPGSPLIPQATLPAALQSAANIYASDNEVNLGNVDTALLQPGVTTASASYFTPFYMHGSMGASAAVADFSASRVTVWSGTQGPYPLRAAISAMLGLSNDSVHVIYSEASGC